MNALFDERLKQPGYKYYTQLGVNIPIHAQKLVNATKS
jgi:hypothetical protein